MAESELRMRLVTVKMPQAYVEMIDFLVKAGFYTSRSDAIRIAVRMLLEREMKRINMFVKTKDEPTFKKIKLGA